MITPQMFRMLADLIPNSGDVGDLRRIAHELKLDPAYRRALSQINEIFFPGAEAKFISEHTAPTNASCDGYGTCEICSQEVPLDAGGYVEPAHAWICNRCLLGRICP